MAKPTEVLSAEHKFILKVIGALERECDALEKGKAVDAAFFKQAIDFIRNYADKFHHAKEEDVLFKELGKDDVDLPCNPVQQMLIEHQAGRDYVKGLEAGLLEGDKKKVARNARGYALLLREHISKEDGILYEMAKYSLKPQVQEAMLARFNEIGEKNAALKSKWEAFANACEARK